LALLPGWVHAQQAASNADVCGVLSRVWGAAAFLERRAGVSFADAALQQGRHDPVVASLAREAQAGFGLPAQAASDLVVSLGLFQRSRLDGSHCEPETFATAASQLLTAYAEAPEAEILTDIVAQLVMADEEKSFTPKLKDLLLSLDELCKPAVLLEGRIRGSTAVPLLEPLVPGCSADSSFLAALADSVGSDLLRVSLTEAAWRACQEDCQPLFAETIHGLLEVGLPRRVVKVVAEQPSPAGPAVRRDLAVSLALTHDLAKAEEVRKKLDRGAVTPRTKSGVNTMLHELLDRGAISSRTVAEAYLNSRADPAVLLFLARYPPDSLRGTKASAAWLIVETISRLLADADAELQQYPALNRFSEVRDLAAIELREAERLYRDAVVDVPGSLSLSGEPASTKIDRFRECEGASPVAVKSLCFADESGVSKANVSRFFVSHGPLGPGVEGLWVIRGQEASRRVGLLGIAGRPPFAAPDVSLSSLASSCIEQQGSMVTVHAGGLAVKADLREILADPDGDGLSTSVEHYLGSDPEVADSDGDGIFDIDDPAPSFPQQEDSGQAWRKPAGIFWQKLVAPVFSQRPDDRGCERFGGVLFIVSADRELGLAAADTGARIVPVLPHEANDLLPGAATFRVRMFGIDPQAGVAFFDWSWGSAGGTMLLERSGTRWVVASEHMELS